MDQRGKKNEGAVEKSFGRHVGTATAVGMGGVAGGVSGAGAGAAVGFAALGPPGAAVGFLVGLFGGTFGGAKAAVRLFHKLEK